MNTKDPSVIAYDLAQRAYSRLEQWRVEHERDLLTRQLIYEAIKEGIERVLEAHQPPHIKDESNASR